jgi:hypothetical protein
MTTASLEPKDYITIIGIAISVILSACSLIVSWSNSKKTLFINSVTASRIKWMDTVRNDISEISGLILHIGITEMDNKQEREIFEKIDRLRFRIKLLLNRSDFYDREIMKIIDNIIIMVDDEIIDEDELIRQIDWLIIQTQDLLKLEWEGVKEETKRGNLSKKAKSALYKTYLQNDVTLSEVN